MYFITKVGQIKMGDPSRVRQIRAEYGFSPRPLEEPEAVEISRTRRLNLMQAVRFADYRSSPTPQVSVLMLCEGEPGNEASGNDLHHGLCAEY